ncbi:hypothetical protein NFI96_005875 [Prochilodus magdalenae]|nr:hypothetical protein NFI96_005875 [Prochilodus magdalenae]
MAKDHSVKEVAESAGVWKRTVIRVYQQWLKSQSTGNSPVPGKASTKSGPPDQFSDATYQFASYGCYVGIPFYVQSNSPLTAHSIRHSYLAGPPCRCPVRDDSSSAAAQCSVGHPLVLHQCPQDTAHRTLPKGTLPMGHCPTGRCPQGRCPQDSAHRTLPTGRCPKGRCPWDTAPQDAAHRDAAHGTLPHRMLPHRTLPHRTLPTGRCPQDAAHRTLPTGRCPQDAAPQDAVGLDILLEQLFISFEEKPQGAASLAQVHKAVLPDGRTVAVKVQHPKVQAQSSKDIVVMEFLLQVVHWLFPDFAFMWLVEEAKRNMPLELDFLNEGRNAEKVAHMLKQFDFLKW